MIWFIADRNLSHFGLASLAALANNDRMVLQGRVRNGVVVFEGNSALPEGAAVTITFPALPPTDTSADTSTDASAEKRRIHVPLVRCDHPGSVHLTGERIAEILDQEDAPSRH